MAAELEYMDDKTDWARVVETPDSARILPPDRPPQARFFDGPLADRIGAWMFVGIVAGIVGVVVLLVRAVAMQWRLKPPTGPASYVFLAIMVGVTLGVLTFAACMIWLLAINALPERCQILVHVTGTVVRSFRGRWRKLEIARGQIRTVLISGVPPRSATIQIGSPRLPAVSLMCDGVPFPVRLGRYEHAVARDIAQAIVQQHERLGIMPAPRVLDLIGREIIVDEPEGEPRWHMIERKNSEVRITPVGSQAPQPPAILLRLCSVVSAVAVVAYVSALAWAPVALRPLALALVVYAAFTWLPWLLHFLFDCQRRTYIVGPDTLMVIDQHRLGSSRQVIRRDGIAAVRLAQSLNTGTQLAIALKGGGSRGIPFRHIDMGWEMAALLRRELDVPAATAEENAIGAVGTGGAVPGAIEPEKHYVQLHKEGDAVTIEKPVTRLCRSGIVYGIVGLVLLLGSIGAAFLIVPDMADQKGRPVATFCCIVAMVGGMVFLVLALVHVVESFRFVLTPTHLEMYRTLPWGTRRDQWEISHIAEIRIEGMDTLVLEDWTGRGHQLVSAGHAPSIRYATSLLRKHLAAMRARGGRPAASDAG